MNMLTPIPLTMSSLEIAGLAGKRHDNVLRDIRKMSDELGLSLNFEEKSSGAGRPLTVINLPKLETMSGDADVIAFFNQRKNEA